MNVGFTLFTIFAHPKRLANFPRAIKIYRASRKVNLSTRTSQEPPSDVKEAQKRVNNAYEWYIYEGEFACPPGKLLIVLIFWNIGSFVQYGICGK